MTPEQSYKPLLADLISGDEDRAEAAARRLAEAGEAVLPALEPLRHSDVPDRRWWAVRTVAQMNAPRLDWLMEALGDASSDVRAAAALGLSSHPVEQAAPRRVIPRAADRESNACHRKSTICRSGRRSSTIDSAHPGNATFRSRT